MTLNRAIIEHIELPFFILTELNKEDIISTLDIEKYLIIKLNNKSFCEISLHPFKSSFAIYSPEVLLIENNQELDEKYIIKEGFFDDSLFNNKSEAKELIHFLFSQII